MVTDGTISVLAEVAQPGYLKKALKLRRNSTNVTFVPRPVVYIMSLHARMSH